MRKILIIGAIVVLAGSGFLAYRLLGTVLVLVENGPVIEARAAWVVGDQVFYRQGDKMDVIESARVMRIIDRFSFSPDDLKQRMAYYRDLPQHREDKVDIPAPRQTADFKRFFAAAAGPARWVGLGLMAVVLVALLSRFLWRKIAAVRSSAARDLDTAAVTPDAAGLRTARSEDIAGFFLRLYTMQMGTDPDTVGEIKRLEAPGAGAGSLFELKVDVGGSWKTRRITIGHLGEETRAKSQCFYVIFDTHMVVKIPSVPIHNFSEYVVHISSEEHVVHALSPRKCIIPNVSAIMTKAYPVKGVRTSIPEQLEAMYIDMLESSPEKQACLKINGAFVFFMDLSGDFFLSQAMAQLRSHEAPSVAAEDARLQSDCQGFEAKYGSGTGWMCFDLQNLYQQFDAEIRRLRDASGQETPISDDQSRLWFFSCLGNPNTPPPAKGFSERFKIAAGDLLTRLFDEQAELVATYRQHVVARARELSFRRCQPQMSALVTNILDLLDWLASRHTAIRDLKAENLLVVGDPNQYPMFLASEKKFSIGLIDLETAVIYPKHGQGTCPQPQIGGTPSYATPSQFFSNKVLHQFYPDMGTLLHLQDWQAIVGLIFELVTGRRLFHRAALQLKQTIGIIKKAKIARRPLEDIYPWVNGLFWYAAGEELRQQAGNFSHRLETVTAVVPEALRRKLEAFGQAEATETGAGIRRQIARQTFIRSKEKMRQMTACTSRTIRGTIEKTRQSPSAAAEKVLPFLEKLAERKHRLERFDDLNPLLNGPICRLPAGDIIWLMFEYVAREMTTQTGDLKSPVAQTAPLDHDMTPPETDTAALGATHVLQLD